MKYFFSLIMALMFAQLSAQSQLAVMTYNIKYANENDGENSWSLRKDALAAQVGFYEPDIFGVQEALYSQLQFLKEKLPEYEFVGKGRDGGFQKGEFSAIFFKTDKYELLQNDTFWLSTTPEIASKGWDAAYPRVCTYAKFKVKATKKEFWIFNTHFDHVGVEARAKSARLIVQKIEKLNKNNDAVILMGDFNLEPESAEIQYLSEQFSDTKTAAKLSFGPSGTFNAYEFHNPVIRRIDYIFTNYINQIDKYGVLSDSQNLKYLSDHFPVLVYLQLLD